ncbi:class I SAM-dependent methyltransferase [Geodermatophilus sp. SYSU D01036]
MDTEPTLSRNASFDDDPHGYDAVRASGHMTRRRLDVFLQALDEVPGPVLELGSGTGVLLRRLAAARPDRQLTGVEPIADYVAFAAAQARQEGLANVRFELGTAERLPPSVESGSVGLLLSVDALHHVDDVDRTVAEAARIAAPNARWRAMEPNRLHPYVWAYHTFTAGERTFPVRGFLRRARRAGWRPVSCRSLFLYPSGVEQVPDWASRLERRLEGVRALAGGIVVDLVRAG